MSDGPPPPLRVPKPVTKGPSHHMPSLPVTMASTSLCAGSLPLAAANAATTVPAAFDLSVPPLEIRALMSARDWGRCCDQIGASGCCGQARCRPGSAAAPPPPPGHRLLSASLSHSSHREPSSHGVRWRWPYGNIDIIRGRFLADLSVLHPATNCHALLGAHAC